MPVTFGHPLLPTKVACQEMKTKASFLARDLATFGGASITHPSHWRIHIAVAVPTVSFLNLFPFTNSSLEVKV